MKEIKSIKFKRQSTVPVAKETSKGDNDDDQIQEDDDNESVRLDTEEIIAKRKNKNLKRDKELKKNFQMNTEFFSSDFRDFPYRS